MMERPAAAAALSAPAAAETALERLAALTEQTAGSPTARWLAVPAPLADPALFLEDAPEGHVSLWAPPDDTAFACVGAAETIVGQRSDRMQHLMERGSTLLAKVTFAGDTAAPRPRCLGGFAFRAGEPRDASWQPFGDATFVLPRLAYCVRGGSAWLVLTLLPDEHPEKWLDLAARQLSRLQRGHRDAAPLPEALSRDDLPRDAWRHLVGDAKRAIAAHRLDKVVTARRSVVRFDRELDPLDVLSRLEQISTGCTRFAFRFDRSTFLGASPERLVRRRGLHAETEALAGSIRTNGPDSSRDLMGSLKERSEHDLVVREITRLLEPIAGTVESPRDPEARTFRHIQHLRTPIHITLSSPLHVLRLVDRLHPTPAVGGAPTREALSWIAEHEQLDRGWYAGPVGWFDRDGDGEFAVALRSGLLCGDTAHLFAGGGVVAESDPDAEYAETSLKLAALGTALGLAQ
jgi:menaquinone-specific isochorismate synthase